MAVVIVVPEDDDVEGITVVVGISMGVGRLSFRIVAAERVIDAERDFTWNKKFTLKKLKIFEIFRKKFCRKNDHRIAAEPIKH